MLFCPFSYIFLRVEIENQSECAVMWSVEQIFTEDDREPTRLYDR